MYRSVGNSGLNRMSTKRLGRRGSEMIAAEIIRAASKGMPKTRIMYSARLNYKQLTKYLDGLTREGLLHSDDNGGVFTTTERGMAFLNSYDEVEA